MPIPERVRPAAVDARTLLSTLWIFATLNYLYCDVLGLMDPKLLPGYLAGNVQGIQIDQGFLLSAGVLVEIPIAMVLLARVLPYGANRWANIAAATVMTAVQVATLFVGSLSAYYAFFSALEIGCTAFILWYAARWRDARPIRTA